jgi:pyruvate formate lyase activating enzyme
VYVGNVAGSGGENTRCPGCGSVLIERYGVTLLSNRVDEGRCPDSGDTIEGVAMDGGLPAPEPLPSPSAP